MRNQITASAFWSLFRSTNASASSHLPEIEVLRHRCLLGFTALDASLQTFWQSSVLPEWDETRSLIAATLDAPASGETLDELTEHAGGAFKKTQLVATLRYLSLIESNADFAPSLFDFASYLLVRGSGGERGAALARQLCQLHELRVSAGPASRVWSELAGHRSVKAIEETARMLTKLGKNFEEAFGETLPARAVSESAA